jgi:hypothetical protein
MGRSYSSGGPPVPFDFELDGVQFVAVGGVQTLELSELALHDTENPNSAAGMASTAMVFRHALGDDYERFRQHCREHGGDHLGDTLLEIIRDMVEHLAESPTKPSGRSSSGRQDTGGTSKAEPRETPQLTMEEIRAWRAANADTHSPE